MTTDAPIALEEDQTAPVVADTLEQEQNCRPMTASFSKDQSPPAKELQRPLLGFSVRGHGSLLASILFGVTSHLVLKFGVLQLQAQPGDLIPYLWIVLGLVIYALGTVCWMFCLSCLDLSYAYPFTGLSYVLIFVASWLIFGDSFSLQRFGGVLVICLGVAFISRENHS